MRYTIEDLLLGSALLLFVSILLSKNLGKLGIPALALFLGVGVLAGSEGIGGIYFDNFHTAQSLGTIALTIILFSGGLDTRWESIQPVLWRGITLSTLGVLVTALLVGLFATYILGFSATPP